MKHKAYSIKNSWPMMKVLVLILNPKVICMGSGELIVFLKEQERCYIQGGSYSRSRCRYRS